MTRTKKILVTFAIAAAAAGTGAAPAAADNHSSGGTTAQEHHASVTPAEGDLATVVLPQEHHAS
ncbi:hypothetical protein ABZW18_21615 [Streptomyces sp. NPDC004647]|uniref:hypothetical protein n=1 Tax=Streptomyces sp. NPDC004647 TaxID=3154671 RepID=UPI0033A30577